jgi:UDP-N-acetylmuramyl-tripeptide synthetase
MEAPLTTPDPITLQRLLRQMADDGVTHVVMEVSSHALAQGRLHGLQFDVAAFTNLSRDHLDFHHDMTKYFDSKKQLFLRHMSPSGKIVIGLNSPAKGRTAPGDADWGEKLCDALSIGCGPQVQQAAPTERQSNDTLPPVATCGLDRHADIHPHSFAYDLDGIRAQVNTPAGTIRIRSPLVGDFNMKNLLTSIGIGLQLGFDPEMIGQALNAVANIPGRLERITSRCGAYIFVDYAHTPDALENVLTTLQRLQPLRLICVFGCGGDRDSGKRPLMGEIAGRLCDVVLVTSDNPRSEDPETIIQEIEDGLAHSALIRIPASILMQHSHQRGYDCLISRQQAIKTAVQHARAGEVVLIAGKGHECYQLTSTGRHFFDDRIEAGKYVNGDALC